MTCVLRYIVSLIGVVCFCSQIWAQASDVVVLVDSTAVNVSNENSYATYRHREIWLASPHASDMTDIVLSLDSDDDLLSFEYQMFDKQGTLMRTVKKKDLKRVEYSQELASNYYRLIAEATPPSYPVLIKETIKLARHANVLSYPMFAPQSHHDMEVQHAVYQITWPVNKVTMRHKALNISQQTPRVDGGKAVLTYVLDGLSPIPFAKFSMDLNQQVPVVMFAPEQISYYKTKGSMADWQSFGLWCYGLTEGSHLLPEEIIKSQELLLANCQNNLEKVKVLHDLMASHTRYVSLQLGIGGYQPKSAGDVYAMGFGDCKGLSNFMRSLLLAAGIESRLAIVSTREPRLVADFANFQQMDHMILEVFLPEAGKVDTLWLECTNPDLPLGYIHPAISGHDVIEISDQGGNLLTIPEYADSLNLKHTDIYLDLQADASASVYIDSRHDYHQYSAYAALLRAKEQKQRSSLLSLYALPNAMVGTVNIADDSQLGGIPRIVTHVDATCPKYANQTGRRLFVPVNPICESTLSGIDLGTTSQPLYIEHGYRDEVEIHLSLPVGVSIESLPLEIDLEEDFVSFNQSVEQVDDQIIVKLRFDIQSGTYPAEARTRLAEIQRMVTKAYTSKIVLLKK